MKKFDVDLDIIVRNNDLLWIYDCDANVSCSSVLSVNSSNLDLNALSVAKPSVKRKRVASQKTKGSVIFYFSTQVKQSL